ncbi:YaaL family protein [Falsibacillus albus]|uniref:DUF2508 family protein n=1 Tax=Falsibacillus albus TaxID=2478915 RepID=A0A3L7JH65_9BACI|nr:YaaL family protein [Falsibacillus albus]RLQ90023.1 DUF2508 family protein [Falsibacillus albus]
MLFKRKGKLRKEYNQKLIHNMEHAKQEWFRNRSLVKLSIDYNEDLICQTKLAEAKYFFLFKEVKKRNIIME